MRRASQQAARSGSRCGDDDGAMAPARSDRSDDDGMTITNGSAVSSEQAQEGGVNHQSSSHDLASQRQQQQEHEALALTAAASAGCGGERADDDDALFSQQVHMGGGKDLQGGRWDGLPLSRPSSRPLLDHLDAEHGFEPRGSSPGLLTLHTPAFPSAMLLPPPALAGTSQLHYVRDLGGAQSRGHGLSENGSGAPTSLQSGMESLDILAAGDLQETSVGNSPGTDVLLRFGLQVLPGLGPLAPSDLPHLAAPVDFGPGFASTF